MPKITFIGAGSTVFAKNLLGDILSYPALAESTLCLFDIDPKRLELSELVAKRIANTLAVKPIIEATTDREHALDGADYAINMIQVGGYRPATLRDFEIPKRYGLRQTIGDTLGIGGIMRGLRSIPVLLGMLQDMERLCPQVLHLNYVNPMAMITWALNRASSIPTVGLCHSVPGTVQELAQDLRIPADEIDYLCAGINHMAFYLKLEHQGRSLYPPLQALADAGQVPDWNRSRYALLQRFGYFVTESSEHLAEYVPWFIKAGREDLLARYNIPLDEYPGRCEVYEVAWQFIERELRAPGSVRSDDLAEALAAQAIDVMPRSVAHTVADFATLNTVSPSLEYGARIIHSHHSGQPCVIYGNVPNHGLIDNLPAGCCVEVPCVVDKNGVQPTHIGSLPPQLAALMQTNINVQALTVEAALTGKLEHVYHAAMLDPHTAAELDPEQICALVDDLLEAHHEYLPAHWRPQKSATTA